jgi:hypothetical protein
MLPGDMISDCPGDLVGIRSIALAPAGFGPCGGDLLIGNFSYTLGEINAYNPVTGAFLGTLDSITR